MNKKRTIAAVIMFLLAVSLFFGGYKAGAAGNGAGSVSDPLITKSYLDQRLAQSGVGGGGAYSRIDVAKGKKITLPETGQLFMYSGAGTIADGKFVDLSTGDVFEKGNVMVNYNLFFAVEGNASILVASDAVFYVQGTCTVE